MKQQFSTKIKLFQSPGFSLIEVLIAIGLVGVILSLTIPGLTKSREIVLRKEIIKETVVMLEQVLQEGRSADKLTFTNFGNYFRSRINAVKICPTNASDTSSLVNPNGPCWDETTQGIKDNLTGLATEESRQPGLILANGATIIGIDDGRDSGGGVLGNGLYIDWNGSRGPNQEGTDQIAIGICYGSSDCPASVKTGTIVSYPGRANSQTLYDSIFYK